MSLEYRRPVCNTEVHNRNTILYWFVSEQQSLFTALL
jgi:hypothetical protein